MAKSKPPKDLEEALRVEKQERSEAEDRAKRANERARESDESYRKLQLELVAAKDEAYAARDALKSLEDKVARLETDLAEAKSAAKPKTAPPPKAVEPTKAAEPAKAAEPTKESELYAQVEAMLRRIESLRELLGTASNELSQLNADEVALSKKRSRVLTDACALLARAVGETGQAPPPIPNVNITTLGARLSVAPSVDISEVAELIESLRPPKSPKVD